MTELSRRGLLQAAAVGAAGLGAGGIVNGRAQAAETDLKPIYEAAKKEGQVTWSSGFLNQQIVAKMGNAFSEKWPGISVSATKTTSQVAFQRLLQDINGGVIQSDVFSSTDVSHMNYLQKKDLLIHFEPPNAKGMVKALQNFDPKGDYYVAWVGIAAICYNTSKVSEAESPKDWPDLANPKWKDKVTFGSPLYSGMVGNWTVAMEEKYGWDFFEKLNALNPLIGRSIDDAITVLNSGERIVGLVSVASALRSAAKGNPLAVNYPTGGTLAVPSPAAVIKGCKNPNAGKLFLDFMCGPEYSKILAEEYEQPLRPEVAPPKGAKSLDDVKVLTPSLGEIEKVLPENKKRWKETFT